MFEIETKHEDLFERYLEKGIAYKGGVYDFTFENRYLIYHIDRKTVVSYIAIDIITDRSSRVTSKKHSDMYTDITYHTMIPDILYSVKHTGDRRYLCSMAYYNIEPIEMINTIFRVVLPHYGYGIREAQINLCIDMFNGLTKKQVAICEAEVGTGKTLAYLVAGIVAKYYYKQQYQIAEPVTISTSSIELQRSLVNKEIPNLSRMLMEYFIIPKPISVVLRKGRENYICPHRFNDYLSKLEQFPEKYSEMLKVLNDIKNFPFGMDLDNYPLNRHIKKKINNIGACFKCNDKENCDYKHMMNCICSMCDLDFQVLNHNLYLTSMKPKNESEIFHAFSSPFVIVDEAHKFKEAAQDVFGFSFSVEDIVNYAEFSKGKCMFKKNIAKYNGLILQLIRISEDFIKSVKEKSKTQDLNEGGYGVVKFDSSLALYCKRIIQKLNDIEDLKLPSKNGQAVQYTNLISAFDNFLDYENNLAWVSVNNDGETIFHCTPMNISELLYELVWGQSRSHVLTSGTMSDGSSFEYFKLENGLNNVQSHLISESVTESSFDYKNNARLYIPNKLPKIKDNPNYIKEISTICLELIRATNGHTIILFTSYGDLNSVYAEIKEQLIDLEIIKMTRGNKTAISRFKKVDNAVLLAAGSMWEGIDISGDKLSSVIIVRLPFPQRNIFMEKKKNECSNIGAFINTYCVPNMLIKLRQGVGRLIRTETDTGVVSILDERVAYGGRYRHKVLKTLSKFCLSRNVKELKEFFVKVKPLEYWNRTSEKGE